MCKALPGTRGLLHRGVDQEVWRLCSSTSRKPCGRSFLSFGRSCTHVRAKIDHVSLLCFCGLGGERGRLLKPPALGRCWLGKHLTTQHVLKYHGMSLAAAAAALSAISSAYKLLV